MRCFLNIIIAVILLLPARIAMTQDRISQFRHLSLMIRDELPSISEAKDYHNNVKTLDQFIEEWLTSSEHEERLRRYFNDMFGMDPLPFITGEQFGLEFDTDHYKLPSDVRSSCARSEEMTYVSLKDGQAVGAFENRYLVLPDGTADGYQFWIDEQFGSNLTSPPGSITGSTEVEIPFATDDIGIISTELGLAIDSTSGFRVQFNTLGLIVADLTVGERVDFNAQDSGLSGTVFQNGTSTLQEVVSVGYSGTGAQIAGKFFTFGYQNASNTTAMWFDNGVEPTPTATEFTSATRQIAVPINDSDGPGGILTAIVRALNGDSFVLSWAQTSSMLVFHSADGSQAAQFTSDSNLIEVNEMSPGGNKISVDAWWSDTPISVCANAVSNRILIPDGNVGELSCQVAGGDNSIFNELCGCGPNMILCFPSDDQGKIRRAISYEFADRALWVYEQNGSWKDLLASDQFYGDRYLYWFYLLTGANNADGPDSTDMGNLNSLPIDGSRSTADMPQSGAPRAGVATMPSFMKEYNNFRSRIRAITNQLLCKDVDSSLNTDGIQTFVNTSLSAADVAHGEKTGCASCHYGLDNFASTILGWEQEGIFNYWEPKLQDGHVFGVTGNGPKFLMEGYIDRSNVFHSCMAKRAFEDFSGNDWDSLSPESQKKFTDLANETPRQLIQGILKSSELKDMRTQKTVETSVTQKVTYDFNSEINPILKRSCGGGDCHNSGSSLGDSYIFEGKESRFKAINKDRLLDGSMPPANSGQTISDEDRDKLILFIKQ